MISFVLCRSREFRIRAYRKPVVAVRVCVPNAGAPALLPRPIPRGFGLVSNEEQTERPRIDPLSKCRRVVGATHVVCALTIGLCFLIHVNPSVVDFWSPLAGLHISAILFVPLLPVGLSWLAAIGKRCAIMRKNLAYSIVITITSGAVAWVYLEGMHDSAIILVIVLFGQFMAYSIAAMSILNDE